MCIFYCCFMFWYVVWHFASSNLYLFSRCSILFALLNFRFSHLARVYSNSTQSADRLHSGTNAFHYRTVGFHCCQSQLRQIRCGGGDYLLFIIYFCFCFFLLLFSVSFFSLLCVVVLDIYLFIYLFILYSIVEALNLKSAFGQI
jgi:hypothetical protein